LSDDEIKAYLTSRYSDFILYRPDVNKNTWALWGAPVVLLLLGLFLLRRMSSKKSQPIVPTVTSNERDQERLRKLLGDDKGDVQQ
jgi:cytochrome c-type biogenesis protein CcmH